MNFYFDFEATQFTQVIISVGCVAENGQTFYSLVHTTRKNKITNFITDLTGITKDMIREAPEIDEVMLNLEAFMKRNTDGNPDFYFVYGDSDADFLKNSIRYTKMASSRKFLSHLAACVGDYTPIVRRHYALNRNVGLRKLLSLLRGTEVEQSHNALEDAQFLKELAGYVNSSEECAVCPWGELNMTAAGEVIAPPKPIRMIDGPNVMIFQTAADARDYVWNNCFSAEKRAFYAKDRARANKNMKRDISKAINKKVLYFNRIWERVEDGEEN